MMLKKGFFLLLIQFYFVPLYSQHYLPSESVYQIDTVLEEYGSLLDHAEIVFDKNDDITIEDILNNDREIDFLSFKNIKTIDKKHVYWIRFSINNDTQHDLDLNL